MSLTDLGISLGQDEQVIAESSFSYSILLNFIKWKVCVTNKRFIARIPNVVLFVIPLGTNLITFPLRNISTIATATEYKLWGFFVAGILIFFGFGNLSSLFGFIAFLYGIILAIASFQTLIRVDSAGAKSLPCSIAVWEKEKALEFTNKINQAITEL
ncbi:MAG: hypothetical protein V7K97_21050 [Nostoc sp.]|uniref:hypothetical protein n=1 Tax=Nostoc sp. TaxID=1180 RepID=UPI002FF80C88